METKERIAVIKQKTSYFESQDFLKYLEKVGRVINKSSAEIIIGPELSLSSSVGMLSVESLEKKMDSLSSCFSKKLVIPGTGLFYDDKKKLMHNIAPILLGNGKVSYVRKNSSHVEEMLAEPRGLQYCRGNLSEGFFLRNGQGSFLVEICRDHGLGKSRYLPHPPLKFQFILANNLLGVSPAKTLVEEGGIVVLAEGEKPASSCAYRKIKKELIPLKVRETEDYFLFS